MTSRVGLSLSGLAAAAAVTGGVALLPSGHAAPAAPAVFTCPAPRAVPAGFDYPQRATTIMDWVAQGDVARARVHGWNVWAALNFVQGGAPTWQSWCTETQAFGPPKLVATGLGKVPTHGSRPMRAFKFDNGPKTGDGEPINFPVSPVYAIPQPVKDRYRGTGCVLPPAKPGDLETLANGPTFQNNGDVMVAGVIYNQPASDWIRSKRLYQTATLQGMMPGAQGQAAIPAMPAGSIALKPMMWPVKRDGYTALPLWDDQKADDGRYAGFEIQRKWPRAVAISTTPLPAPASVSFLHGVTMADGPSIEPGALGPNTYVRPGTATVRDFYNYRPNLATIAACDRAILDASAYYAYGRLFEQGDYLVLIAMHIMTKEQPAWTFQSLWWHDRPDAGPYAADRPHLRAGLGPWEHYLMASTYGIPVSPGASQWPIAYNPYIELAADHPIETNCMNCHHRAAWPNDGTGYEVPGGPGALDIFAAGNAKIYDGKLSVDSLWSISDRVPVPGKTAVPVALKTRLSR